jgi:hypothetical protein
MLKSLLKQLKQLKQNNNDNSKIEQKFCAQKNNEKSQFVVVVFLKEKGSCFQCICE